MSAAATLSFPIHFSGYKCGRPSPGAVFVCFFYTSVAHGNHMTGLLFRLRRLRHSDQAIAASVRETLVESLYASPQSLVIGALTSSAE